MVSTLAAPGAGQIEDQATDPPDQAVQIADGVIDHLLRVPARPPHELSCRREIEANPVGHLNKRVVQFERDSLPLAVELSLCLQASLLVLQRSAFRHVSD